LVLRAGPGAKGDGGPPLRAQGPGALGPPGRGWDRRWVRPGYGRGTAGVWPG